MSRNDTGRAERVYRGQLRRIQANVAGQGFEDSADWDSMEIRPWVMDCAKDAWVSKVDKTRMHRYQMGKQLYGL
jgi:hypothetical protein